MAATVDLELIFLSLPAQPGARITQKCAATPSQNRKLLEKGFLVAQCKKQEMPSGRAPRTWVGDWLCPFPGLEARLPDREAGWEIGLPKDGGRIEKLDPLPRGPEGFGRAGGYWGVFPEGMGRTGG